MTINPKAAQDLKETAKNDYAKSLFETRVTEYQTGGALSW